MSILQTLSIANYYQNKHSYKSDDVSLFIVRRATNRPSYKLIHVPQLAPSDYLFNMYLGWRGKLKNNDWWAKYQVIFAEQMKLNSFQIRIDRIVEILKEGRNVRLICYCNDYHYCHRSLVAAEIMKKIYSRHLPKCNNCKYYSRKGESNGFYEVSCAKKVKCFDKFLVDSKYNYCMYYVKL